jgi:hypothetical protein
VQYQDIERKLTLKIIVCNIQNINVLRFPLMPSNCVYEIQSPDSSNNAWDYTWNPRVSDGFLLVVSCSYHTEKVLI